MNRNSNHDPAAPLQMIPDAAKITGLSQYFLRKGVREGTVPFIRSGRVIYINVPRLLEQLDGQTTLPRFQIG